MFGEDRGKPPRLHTTDGCIPVQTFGYDPLARNKFADRTGIVKLITIHRNVFSFNKAL